MATVTAKQTPDLCSLEHFKSVYSLKNTEGLDCF